MPLSEWSSSECRQVFATHADGCEFLGPAIEEDRIEEELETIEEDDWPSYELFPEDPDTFGEPEEED